MGDERRLLGLLLDFLDEDVLQSFFGYIEHHHPKMILVIESIQNSDFPGLEACTNSLTYERCLRWAVKKGDVESIETLIDKGASIEDAYINAAEFGKTDIMSQLRGLAFASNKDISTEVHNEAMAAAIIGGHTSLAQELERGIAIARTGQYNPSRTYDFIDYEPVLYSAVKADNSEAVDWLKNKNFDFSIPILGALTESENMRSLLSESLSKEDSEKYLSNYRRKGEETPGKRAMAGNVEKLSDEEFSKAAEELADTVEEDKILHTMVERHLKTPKKKTAIALTRAASRMGNKSELKSLGMIPVPRDALSLVLSGASAGGQNQLVEELLPLADDEEKVEALEEALTHSKFRTADKIKNSMSAKVWEKEKQHLSQDIGQRIYTTPNSNLSNTKRWLERNEAPTEELFSVNVPVPEYLK